MKTLIIKISDDCHADIKSKAVETERSVVQYIRDLLVTAKHPFMRSTPNTEQVKNV
tara:strand:+ start:83 stop:250 length:168 start_codon:yes stop_codon:yes gene_type:complete